MGIQISPGRCRKGILKSWQRKTKAKRPEVLLPSPGTWLLRPDPGRLASCTGLGCKHTDRLFLHLFPPVKLGLLLNYQKYQNARHESCAWPGLGASAPGVAAKVPREESWQLLNLRAASIAKIAETAWPGALSCSVPTARAGLCPCSKGN